MANNKSGAAKSADKQSADKPAVEKPKTHRVIATRKGYYGEQLRPVGSVFNIKIKSGEKWPSWVEPFDDEAPANAAAPSEPAAQSTDSSDDVI